MALDLNSVGNKITQDQKTITGAWTLDEGAFGRSSSRALGWPSAH